VLTMLLLVTAAAQMDAQVRRGRQVEEQARWAPPSVGVRGGYDQRANAEALGAQIRLPVVRSGVLELIPSADVAFLNGAKDYQYGVEAAWVPGGIRRGIFIVGGVAWRDTPLGQAVPVPVGRNTFFGYVLGAGAASGVGPLEFELAIRWTFLDDTTYRPNLASLGVNYPFWSVLPSGRR
ncbi:MAG: hypothetical protein HKO77_00150, partial [Gemmatimonadetes bacterium]|nr:hypothetical protein [Gemmatimonadota bacterium]